MPYLLYVNRLPDKQPKGTVFLSEHLVGKINHLNIELYPQRFPYVGKPVEEIGVLPCKVHGHYAPVVFKSLFYVASFPFKICNGAVYLSGTETCRKI